MYMKGRQFIGIDVSKSSLDVCIHSLQAFAKFDNNERGIKGFVCLSTSWYAR